MIADEINTIAAINYCTTYRFNYKIIIENCDCYGFIKQHIQDFDALFLSGHRIIIAHYCIILNFYKESSYINKVKEDCTDSVNPPYSQILLLGALSFDLQ